MTRILDHRGAYISSGETDFGREMCAIRMIAANRQHRQLQFALGDELLIVDSVLRERGILSAEGVVDGVWTRIKRGIVVARLLVDPRRIG